MQIGGSNPSWGTDFALSYIGNTQVFGTWKPRPTRGGATEDKKETI